MCFFNPRIHLHRRNGTIEEAPTQVLVCQPMRISKAITRTENTNSKYNVFICIYKVEIIPFHFRVRFKKYSVDVAKSWTRTIRGFPLHCVLSPYDALREERLRFGGALVLDTQKSREHMKLLLKKQEEVVLGNGRQTSSAEGHPEGPVGT